MNQTIFAQAVDETFPLLEESKRKDVKEKVSGHMLEVFKEKVFANDPMGLSALNEASQGGNNKDGRSKMYGETIVKRFNSLPKEERDTISQEMDAELTNVMHKIYQAYV